MLGDERSRAPKLIKLRTNVVRAKAERPRGAGFANFLLETPLYIPGWNSPPKAITRSVRRLMSFWYANFLTWQQSFAHVVCANVRKRSISIATSMYSSLLLFMAHALCKFLEILGGSSVWSLTTTIGVRSRRILDFVVCLVGRHDALNDKIYCEVLKWDAVS